MTRKAPLARNIAEAIDDLYRQHAPPRNHERMIQLVQHQIEHAMRMAVEEDRQNANQETFQMARLQFDAQDQQHCASSMMTSYFPPMANMQSFPARWKSRWSALPIMTAIDFC